LYRLPPQFQQTAIMPVSLCKFSSTPTAYVFHINWFHHQGILELYVTHANDYVNGNVAANTAFNISRAKLELTIMRELDKSTLPTAYKLAWFNAVSTPVHLLRADCEQFVPLRTRYAGFCNIGPSER